MRSLSYDLRDLEHLEDLVEQVEKDLGPIDILVNNAASTHGGAFLEFTSRDYLSEFEVTVLGTMALTRVVLQKMINRQSGGSIITMAGDAGRIGESRLAVTSAARAAAMAFAKSIAKEFGRYQIRSNVVSLGLVDKMDTTDNTVHWEPDQLKRLLHLYPLRRLGHMDDVAPLIVLLASDKSAWLTGQVISINGGYSTL